MVTAVLQICGAVCCASHLLKIRDSRAPKWIPVYSSRTTVLWCHMWMMQLSSPKTTQKLSVFCNSSMISTATFHVTRRFHRVCVFNFRIYLMDISNCHSCTTSHVQSMLWVLVMLTHFQLQLRLHCSNTWILCHSTKALNVDQLWAFHSTLGTTLILNVLMQLTLVLVIA